VQIKLENFNNCPGYKVAKDIAGSKALMVEDLPDLEYWQNDEATLVLSINLNTTRLNMTDAFTKVIGLISRYRPDEVHSHPKGNQLFYRLWWD